MAKQNRYANLIDPSNPSQRQPFSGKDQVPNSEGGYVFQVGCWERMRRFLILGSESNTYYVNARKLTEGCVASVEACLREDPARAINLIVAVSTKGRAPKNEPALLALAMACSEKFVPDVALRSEALSRVPEIARIGTHLFQFAEYVELFRGRGSGLQNAMKRWYLEKHPGTLVNQAMKYVRRGSYSHRDLLRLFKPRPGSDFQSQVFKYMTTGEVAGELVDPSTDEIDAYRQLRAAFLLKGMGQDPKGAVKLISDNRLPREVVPTELLNEKMVWEALLEHMPITATIRNLGKMTNVGLLIPNWAAVRTVCDRITDAEILKNGRVHPIKILDALRTYSGGHGIRGSLSWTPVQEIEDALDEAYYKAFDNVPSTGKRYYLGIDVSSSMTYGDCGGSIGLTPNVCAAAMAMVIARTEKSYVMRGFCNKMKDLNIGSKDSLEVALRKTQDRSFGGTDCALPMEDALNRKIPVDVFVVLTDNETHSGLTHPFQALVKYRKAMKIDAKLVVVGMTATDFTIADPSDAGMMDVAGFDTAVPELIADFARKKIDL